MPPAIGQVGPSSVATGAPSAPPKPGSDGGTSGRTANGKFAAGNVIGKPTRLQPGTLAAVTHGLHAATLPPEFQHLTAAVDDFVRGQMVDEGDEHDVSTRRASQLIYRAKVHRRILQLDGALEMRGLFDQHGRLRQSWLETFDRLVKTARALDKSLGLERRQKRLNVAERLAELHERQNG